MRLFTALIICATSIALGACKGSHSGASSSAGGNTIATAAANVATITVAAGPGTTAAINALYTSVKVCAPGSTTNCQTINNIQVDTGTSGLRIMASVLSSTVAAALPPMVDASNNNIVECAEYADGNAWGPVVLADMTIASETASSLPIQIIGSSSFPSVPASCAGTGQVLDTVQALHANGSIGISMFAQDCGSGCALSLDPSINPGFYYACSSATSCAVTTVPLKASSGPQQVQNPVTYFPTDNTGVIIELPVAAGGGSSTLSGALVFGIDTQTNNATDTSNSILTVNTDTGYVGTSVNGVAFPHSFFDTGSSGIFFDYTGLTACTGTLTEYYCPSSTVSYDAIVESSTNSLISIPFSVANAQTLVSASSGAVAFSNLGGPSAPNSFDWGMPFFLGRNVYSVIEGKSTTIAAGPYLSF